MTYSRPDVDGDRLWSRLMALAQIGATGIPGEVNRQTLTDTDAKACELVIGWGREAGLIPAFDLAGNLFLTLEGSRPDLPPILVGSHLDSQPTGGRFDGVVGVLAALEAVSLSAAGARRDRSMAVVVWSNEEGSRFAPGMSGSETFVGRRDLDDVRATTDSMGITQGEALDGFLRHFPDIPHSSPGFPVAAYLELHIEQADVLERSGNIIGAVTGIQGKKTWDITLYGIAAHAGTEPMDRRKDALVSFVNVAHTLKVEMLALAPDAMFTIGRLDILPNAPSVVPAQAQFRVDLRHSDPEILVKLGEKLESVVMAEASPCTAKLRRLVDAPPNAFDPDLCRAVMASAKARGYPAQKLLSAAGHDARHIATVTDRAVMIFIPCRAGLSHHPDEWAEPAHVTAGAQVLSDLLTQLCERTD